MLRRLKNLFYKRGLISVVIPNYNNAQFIKECIESVLSQSLKNIELIIVDDFSTDNSIEIVNSIKDKRIRLIPLKRNIGVSAVRNVGIKASRGRYLTTLDSDDIFCSPFKLEKELEVVKGYEKNHEEVVSFSNIRRISEDGESLNLVGSSETIRQGDIFEGMLTREIFLKAC
jgi:glycosyltransferase involved in cell wall biosynthesis